MRLALLFASLLALCWMCFEWGYVDGRTSAYDHCISLDSERAAQ